MALTGIAHIGTAVRPPRPRVCRETQVLSNCTPVVMGGRSLRPRAAVISSHRWGYGDGGAFHILCIHISNKVKETTKTG